MNRQNQPPTTIYRGPRGQGFKDMIRRLLKKGKLKQKYIEKLTDGNAMKAYSMAFTAASADNVDNYERFEQIGDVTANKFIVWYSYKRFPQLDCTMGVKVVARLRINYGSKDSFSKIAESLGFWDYISAADDGSEKKMKYRNRNKKDLLEDCFESFVGCTEYLIDNAYRPGVGYGVVYDILSNIFNRMDMSIRYVDLYDAKTRLKETFDPHRSRMNEHYINTRDEKVARSRVYYSPEGTVQRPNKRRTGPGKKDVEVFPQNGWVLIGEGTASLKNDAEQLAAEQGIEAMRRLNVYKAPPPEYQRFADDL